MPSLFEEHDGVEAVNARLFAQIALEQGLDTSATGLTYGVPDTLADLSVGERVLVPLGRGNKLVAGYVVELTRQAKADVKRLKWIASRDPQRLSLPVDLIDLARWISSYYCCPLGMVFASMLPAAVKHGTGVVQRTYVRLAGDFCLAGDAQRPAKAAKSPPSEPEEDAARHPLNGKALTKLQQTLIETLKAAGDEKNERAWVEIKTLADHAGARTISPVKRLIDKGILETKQEAAVESSLDLRASKEAEPPGRVTLNPGQQRALDHLVAHADAGFGVHLLHGVTGSGKTEVYLRLIEAISHGESRMADSGLKEDAASDPSAIRHPPSTIVLVPEIALTPQTVGRFFSRFDANRVAVLHSGLTAAQRHQQWRRIREGQANIVVGARSAVFAPLPDLRLIIVDEEHESSYKQDQLPRYHARDVAIKRGQLRGIPVVLGSATPSLESYYNAVGKRRVTSREFRVSSSEIERNPQPETPNPHYHLLRLPDRAPGMRLPTVEVVDMVEERRSRRGIHLLSQRLEQQLRLMVPSSEFQVPGSEQTRNSKLETQPGGRVMLLLNRRGYANYIACPDHRCGWMMTCDACDALMVYHKNANLPTGGLLRCHHCLAEQLLPATCPVCDRKISVFGLGTQRVEEELIRKFPGLRTLRMDSDSMRTGHDYQHSLDAFRRGEVDVLLGTQMIAKGLDFPSVRLVGVISGDTSLHMPDFRAAERTFQLIAQVAGRAGRSETPGRVIVQTFCPHDPVINLAAQHDYDGFAQRELEVRREVGLPPIARMARIVIRDKDHIACTSRARELADHLQAFNTALKLNVRLRGPMPCPIARIANYYRQQIELIADPPQAAARLQKLMTALRNTRLLISDQHTAVDVDPVALL